MRLPAIRDDIEINLGMRYDQVCSLLGGHDVLPRWQELGDVLMRRPGWHFDLVQTDEGFGPLWCFGYDGEALLTVEAELEGFHVFEYGDDDSRVVPQRHQLLEWLHEREDRLDAPSEMARTLRAYLRRQSEERLT